MATADELRKLIAARKLVLGADRTLDLARRGRLSRVYLASNCAAATRESLARAAKLSGFEVVELPRTREELGTLCGKPFAIAAAGVKKD
jgi:large subunit ribosomal protein L30e